MTKSGIREVFFISVSKLSFSLHGERQQQRKDSRYISLWVTTNWLSFLIDFNKEVSPLLFSLRRNSTRRSRMQTPQLRLTTRYPILSVSQESMISSRKLICVCEGKVFTRTTLLRGRGIKNEEPRDGLDILLRSAVHDVYSFKRISPSWPRSLTWTSTLFTPGYE